MHSHYSIDRNQMLQTALTQIFDDKKDGAIEAISDLVEWRYANGGDYLFKAGDTNTEMYIVVSGRLKATYDDDKGQTQFLGEYGAGDTIGEVAMLGQMDKKVSMIAIRDCVLVTLKESQMTKLCAQYPHLLMRISKIAINKLATAFTAKNQQSRVTNIMIYPTDDDVDAMAFTRLLVKSLSVYGSVCLITPQLISQQFGQSLDLTNELDQDKEVALMAWLEQLEHDNRFVIFQTNDKTGLLQKRALRHADRILLLTNHNSNPNPSEAERLLFKNANIKPQLIIQHKARSLEPNKTHNFLKHREISQHYHILENNEEDNKRIARFICGSANGLVFAGGGARGFVHLGVIKAFVENGLPIDILGGTSMGAIMAGAYAMKMDINPLIDEVRDIFVNQKPLTDYTIPFISIFSGKKLDRLLYNFYGEAQIEDCWTQFFCVASNISKANSHVHSHGLLWQTIRSSLSLPGIVPPVNMDGDLFIDGGIVNNYPVDVMFTKGAGTVIGIDIVSDDEKPVHFNPIPDGWTILKNKLLRRQSGDFSSASIGNVLMKSALLSSTMVTKQNTELADFHWGIDASQYGLLKFSSFDQIVEIGYRYASEKINTMNDEEMKQLLY